MLRYSYPIQSIGLFYHKVTSFIPFHKLPYLFSCWFKETIPPCNFCFVYFCLTPRNLNIKHILQTCSSNRAASLRHKKHHSMQIAFKNSPANPYMFVIIHCSAINIHFFKTKISSQTYKIQKLERITLSNVQYGTVPVLNELNDLWMPIFSGLTAIS
jgi:hypothetical protein